MLIDWNPSQREPVQNGNPSSAENFYSPEDRTFKYLY